MTDIFAAVTAWPQAHLWWLAPASVLMLLFSFLAASWLVTRIPADYFRAHRARPLLDRRLHPVLAWSLLILRNLLGLLFLLTGVVMLVTPGQGILTILLGLMLMNYPGKFALERWLVGRPLVLRALNLLRRRKGCAPLLSPFGREDQKKRLR